MKKEKSKKVLIEYLIDLDEIVVKSEFKDPVKTLKLIEMGMEKWINEYIGRRCPDCDETIQANWEYCSFCGKQL